MTGILNSERNGARVDIWLGECLEHLGSPEFLTSFLKLASEIIGADQCMAFVLEPERAQCALSVNFAARANGNHLAEAYLDGGFREDPLHREAALLIPCAGKVFYLSDIANRMTADYRDRFYSVPGLADKVAILLGEERRCLCLNFYRNAGRPRFSDELPLRSDAFWIMVTRLLAAHFRICGGSAVQSPLAVLSERERDVCAGILDGLKAEAIGARLGVSANSVITYRRRAYGKLGISSRSALFALCRKG